MVFTGIQPLDGGSIPISSEYSPQNNSFPAMQGADGAYVDSYGNPSSAPVMSFIQPRINQRGVAQTGAASKLLSFTFQNPNQGGNSIIVCLGVGDIEDSVTSFKVSDTQGNSYTEVIKSPQGSALQSSIFLATGIKSGLATSTTPAMQNTITVQITGPTAVPTGIAMKVYEVWGVIASIDSIDQVDIGSNAGSNQASTTLITPTVPNTMAFTALAVGQIAIITPGGGWSANDGTIFPWGGNLGAFDSQYKQLSTMNPGIAQGSMSLSSPWAMACATFRTIILPMEGVVSFAPCSNAPITSIISSTSSVQFLAANSGRKGMSVFNDSTATLYLAFASTASKTLYTTQVPAGALYEMPLPIYPGIISGIWSAANGSAKVTEFS